MMGLWINLYTGLPRRMDTKGPFIPAAIFLLAILQGSRAQAPTPADHTGAARSSAASTATMFSEKSVSRGAEVFQELKPTEQTTRQNSGLSGTAAAASMATKAPDVATAKPETTFTPSPASSLTPFTSTAEKDAKNAIHQAADWDPSWDEDFSYDYKSLRVIGLSVGGFLFITGLMIISCDKVRRLPKCRSRSSRSYYVAPH